MPHEPRPHRRRRPASYTLICLWLLLPALVQAQTEIPESVQIEVLVFQYANGGAGSESSGRADDQYYGDRYVLSEPPGDGWYRVIPVSKQRLAGASGVLARSSRTRLLLHTGWQQPSRDSRRIVLRSESGTPGTPPEVEGWLELQSGRGLRVALYFDHHRVGDGAQLDYRMEQTRVVNPGEIQYFDHPAFGVLVRVDAVDTAP